MALEGDLAVIGLADIFQTLSASQKAGTLVVENVESRKSIYFQEGMVWVISEGVRKTIKLGEALIAQGKITPAQLATALEQQQITKERLGEILQSMGLVTEGDVEEVIRSQLEEDIFDVFTWKAGKFKFLEETIPEGFDETEDIMNLNVSSIVMEAARRSDELDVIREYIPSDDYVFRVTDGANCDQFDDTFKELVLGMLDGRNTVNDVGEHLGGHRFELKTSLAELMQEEIIEPIPTEGMVELGIGAMEQGDADRAARLLQVAVEQDPSDVGNFLLLAEAYESVGDKKRAGQTYKMGAQAAAEAGEVEHAVDFLARARRLLPNDLEVNEQVLELLAAFSDHIPEADTRFSEEGKALVKAYRREKRYDDAVRLCHRLLQEDPEDIEVHKLLVNVHLDQGDEEEALAEYDVLAQLLTKKKDYEELQSVLEKIAKLDPSRQSQVNRQLEQIVMSSAERRSRAVKKLIKVAVFLLAIVGVGGAGYAYFTAQQEFDELEARVVADYVDMGDYEGARQAVVDWGSSNQIYKNFVSSRISDLNDLIREEKTKSERNLHDAEEIITTQCIPMENEATAFEKALDFGAAYAKKGEALACMETQLELAPGLDPSNRERATGLAVGVDRLERVLAELNSMREEFYRRAEATEDIAKSNYNQARDELIKAREDLEARAGRPLASLVEEPPRLWGDNRLADLKDYEELDFPVLIAGSGPARKVTYWHRQAEWDPANPPPTPEKFADTTPFVVRGKRGFDLLLRFEVPDTIQMIPAGADVEADRESYGREPLLATRELEFLIDVRHMVSVDQIGLIVSCNSPLDLRDWGGARSVYATIYSTPQPFLLFEEFRGARRVETPETVQADPLIAGGTAYYAANSKLYAIASDGELRACDISKAPGVGFDDLRSTPVMAGNTLYAVTRQGKVIEIDPQRLVATKVNPAPAGNLSVTGRAILVGGSVVFSSGTEVFAFDTGSKQFSRFDVRTDAPQRRITGGVAHAGGKLYVPTDKNVLALNYSGGALPAGGAQKHTSHAGAVFGHLVSGNNVVYGFGAEGPNLLALGANGGLGRTRIPNSPPKFKAPEGDPSPVVAPNGDVLVAGRDGTLYRYAAWQNGQPSQSPSSAWSERPLDAGHSLEASPILEGGIVYQATLSGEVVAIDFETGDVLWKSSVVEGGANAGGFQFAPALLPGKLVVASRQALYVIENK